MRPLIAEYEGLQPAHDALASIPTSGTPARYGRKRGPGRPKRSPSGKASAGKRRRATGRHRRKGTGEPAAQTFEIVTGQPGITNPEIAQKMGIEQNYLYRVLPRLEKEKKVSKSRKGWYPAG